MSTGFIYALSCAECQKEGIRYVGQTAAQNPSKRLYSHIYDAARGRTTGVCGWIRKHGSDNIVQVVLERCERGGLNDREAWWIKALSEQGARLHNLTQGGDTDRCLDDDAIAEIRTKYASSAAIKQTDLAREYGVSQATISQVVRGEYDGSEDLSMSGRGRKKEGSGRPGARNPRARLSWQLVDDIRARASQGEAIASIARSYELDYRRVWNVVRMKSWTKGRELSEELDAIRLPAQAIAA